MIVGRPEYYKSSMFYRTVSIAWMMMGLWVGMAVSGCRSPRQLADDADQTAQRYIASAEAAAMGMSNAVPFTVERPSETLRRRLIQEQGLTTRGLPDPTNPPSASPVPLLSLSDALQIAAFNSREFQNQKESVFAAALSLDIEADAFRLSLAGAINTLLAGERGEETESLKWTGDTGVSVARKLEAGATLTTHLAFDVAKLLTGSRNSSLGLSFDAGATIPLLRGAGRAVAREPLTQAERNLLYAIRRFERFKQEFAVRIASEYLSVLQQLQTVRNAAANLERVREAHARAVKMAEAGRIPNLQLDQARQDLLRAESRLNAVRQSFDSRLDGFKLTLGLPPDAQIALLESELTSLSEEGKEPFKPFPEAESLRFAFENRLDLRNAADAVEDAERAVRLARDALRAGLTLKGSFSTRDETPGTDWEAARNLSLDFRRNRWSVGLGYDAPWERTAARNRYRESLIALDRAQRQYEELEDRVKMDIRNGFRNLEEAREAVRIQSLSVELAHSRVASVQLYLQAGRAEMRDLLEAQDALVSAQDALVSALVNRRLAELQFQRDIGSLRVASQGLQFSHETP